MVQEQWAILNGVGISSVNMVAHNLLDVSLTKNMQNVPIQADGIPNNMPYNYTYTLSYICLDDVDVDTIRKTILQILGVHTCVQWKKHILSRIASATCTKKNECGKMRFSVVANFHVGFSHLLLAWTRFISSILNIEG